MLQQVGKALLERFEVLLGQFGLGDSAVILESAYGGDNDYRGGSEPCHAALDVEELLCAEVRGESGFGNNVIAELEGHAGSGN